jgi:hypothetical protein
MDLARVILLAVEQSKDDEPASIRFNTDRSDLEVSHHVRILAEAGLIHALEARHLEGASRWRPHALTWQGHEFLDLIRSDALWARIKQTMNRTGGLNFALLKDIAMQEARKNVPHSISYESDRLHFSS